jgi:hypothetical protein
MHVSRIYGRLNYTHECISGKCIISVREHLGKWFGIAVKKRWENDVDVRDNL